MSLEHDQAPPNRMRSFRALLRHALHLQESPQRTAMAFALGVFIAFSPAYGLHTVMVMLCAWLFGLNFLALLAGALINNPWTIVPILGATYWTGALLLGRTDVPAFNWQDLSVSGLYDQIIPYAAPFVIGGLVLGVIGALVSYPAIYLLVLKHRTATHLSEPQPLPPPDQVG